MAKTKDDKPNAKPRSEHFSRRGSNADDGQNRKNIENGLYTHSSPPKAVPSDQGSAGSANIREYLRGGNISGLEDVVLDGNGNKLLTQSSTDPRVRAFLKTLPSFMSKIDLVHDAAQRGNLRDLKSLLDRRKLARSKDAQGMGLMHKAVLSGNKELVDYLSENYPETAALTDPDGRTPLHYCAASKSPDEMYSTLSTTDGIDVQGKDNRGKTASYYMSRPGDLKVVSKSKFSSGSRKKSTPSKRPLKLSTPPKREGLNINGANIRIWIHDQDLPKLEQIVWEGQGLKLMKETSNIPKVRQFLNLVPRMMIRIKEVHQSAVTGDMEMLQAKADQPELLTAKDQNGLNALHKAAALGHLEMTEWIIQKNQSALFGADKMGRTPLFYATLPSDEGETFDACVRGGADKTVKDRFQKTAEQYRGRPGDLDVSVVYEPPAAPRSGAGALDIPFSRGPSIGPSRAQSRAPSRNRLSRSLNPSRRGSASTAVTPRRSKSTDRGPDKKGKNAENGKAPATLKAMEFEDMSDVTQDDIDKMILDGDVNKLEMVVLSGRGADLRGKSSWNEDVRKFLKKVPGYMENINGLHSAAEDGNLKGVRQMTDKNPRLVMGRASDGTVALHHMAKSGNIAGVKAVYAMYPQGLDVMDGDDRSPLHWAALSRTPGTKETYSFLQKQGADHEVPDAIGKTAEDYLNTKMLDGDNIQDAERKSRASSRENSAKKSTPPSKNNSKNPSRSNSRNPSQNNSRNPSPAPSAKSKGPSRNSSPNPSTKAKHGAAAAATGAAAAAAVDAEMEADVNDSIKRAEDGDYDSINNIIMRGDGRLLLGRSSHDEDTQDYLDKVPGILESVEDLHAAVEDGDTRKVKGLLDKRQKALVLDSNSCNILHKSVLFGHSDLTRYLVQSHPELLNQQDRAGRTPLHYAAVIRDGGHAYKILTKAGADPDVTDREEYTPANYLDEPRLMTEKQLKEELKEGIPLDEELIKAREQQHAARENEDIHHDRNDDDDDNYSDYDNDNDIDHDSNRHNNSVNTHNSHHNDKINNHHDDNHTTHHEVHPKEHFEKVDPVTLSLIEKAYTDLKAAKSDSLLKKHLNQKVFDELKVRTTVNKGSLLDVIKSGVANPDSSIGIYAPDAESYTVFKKLFDPVIMEYHELHGQTISQPHINFDTSHQLGDFNSFGANYVISTRIRCARNLVGFPFNPLLKKEQYTQLEDKIVEVLDTLDGDLSGYYRSLDSLTEKETNDLIEDHLLFKQGDRFLEAANACRFWPHGRGIFQNSDSTLIVWVNEEDHMRIITMDTGGDLGRVYDRFARIVTILEQHMNFSHLDKLGYLSFCPTNLGTGLRASVHIRLRNLSKNMKLLEETASKFNLQVRGTKGEHSDAQGGVFDVSNKRRLGLTEGNAMSEMYQGVLSIIELEHKIETTKNRSPRTTPR